MDLLTRYQRLVKEISKTEIKLSIDSLSDINNAINSIESLSINFIKLGYSDTIVSKYYEAKSDLLSFLKQKKYTLEASADSANKKEAIEFVEKGKSYIDFIEVLRKNSELAAYIAYHTTDKTTKFAMQINIQRQLTNRKLLFCKSQSITESKKIKYEEHLDLKINKLKKTDQVPGPNDTVISIKARTPDYVYSYKHLQPAADESGVTKKMIESTQSIFYKNSKEPDYLSPIDIESCDCVNHIDPLNCDYDSILRPLYVIINDTTYISRCIDSLQLLSPDLDVYYNKSIIHKVKAYKQTPSIIKYEELSGAKLKHALRNKLSNWSKNSDKIENTNILCDILVESVLESLMQLPSDIYLMAKVAVERLVFKERKTIMDSYRFMSEETIKPMMTDIVDRNERGFKTLNENLSLYCKILN